MLVLVLLLGLGLQPGLANAAELTARLTGAPPAPLAARIAGQIADLPWTLEDGEGPTDARVHVAPDGAGGWVVALSDRHGRSFERPVEAGEASATLETLAMVIRSGLRELQAPPPTPPVPLPPPPAVPTRWYAAAGGAVTAAAARDGLRAALELSAGVDSGRWRLGVRADLGLPTSLDDERTQIRLSQHAVRATFASQAGVGEGVSLFVGGAAGLLLIDRTTRADEAYVAPASGRLATAFVAGPELGLDWKMVRLGLAADVVIGAPTLRYRVDGALRTRHDPWLIQPRLTLAFVVGEGMD